MRYGLLLLLLTGVLPGTTAAQPADAAATQPAASALVRQVPREQFAELWFSNRLILTFRAAVVRSPEERAESARQTLSRLIEQNVIGPVGSREVLGASIITVGGLDAFPIVVEDVGGDEVDLPTMTARTIERVQLALTEAAEIRTPARLAAAAARSLLATALLVLTLVLLSRLSRWMTSRVLATAEARLRQLRVGVDPTLLRATRLLEVTGGSVKVLGRLLGAGALYLWVGYVLLQFPLTRPWGEALGGYLRATATRLGLGALYALPGLFTVAIIFLVARFIVRVGALLFEAIENGRIHVPAIGGSKAAPTRRLVTSLVWTFAVIVAYPYLPGSSTDAFKGVSVFIGLIVSLGSSGLVNQLMSGFMITYSGALEPGDYAKIGEVEGTVTQLGVLSTKVRTRRNEEVTIPNAVVSAGITVNYTRLRAQGVQGGTSVTIGYDVPWRQVEAMLLTAAARTAGIRGNPPPMVLQTNLADFYVEYTLLVGLEDPAIRIPTLSAVRANILDVFNEHGVQIMSPAYESDPAAPKVVPHERWFAAPASPRGPAGTPP